MGGPSWRELILQAWKELESNQWAGELLFAGVGNVTNSCDQGRSIKREVVEQEETKITEEEGAELRFLRWLLFRLP